MSGPQQPAVQQIAPGQLRAPPNPTDPFHPQRVVNAPPMWRIGKTDYDVNQTGHLDYSIYQGLPYGVDSFNAYHVGEMPCNLAD